jgi:hypothetical protein
MNKSIAFAAECILAGFVAPQLHTSSMRLPRQPGASTAIIDRLVHSRALKILVMALP